MSPAVRRWVLVAAIVVIALGVHTLPLLLVLSRAHLVIGAILAGIVLVAWHFGLLARVLPRAHGQRKD